MNPLGMAALQQFVLLFFAVLNPKCTFFKENNNNRFDKKKKSLKLWKGKGC